MQSNQFQSNFGFLMAAAGFAVGLGNIWRFPYVTGENGGAVFVAVYLLCVLVIGLPILMAEILIGRRGGGSAPTSLLTVATGERASKQWRHVGHLNLLTGFLIMATYGAVAGWVLWYLFKAVLTGFDGMEAASADAEFARALASPVAMYGWTLAVLVLSGAIVFFGVNDGIERAVRVMMPTLLLLIVALVVYNLFAGGMAQAIAYLFTPDFSKLNGGMVLAAIGQAFFSIGVAMGGMMTFGAYLPRHFSIAQAALQIILIDTVIALLAGLMIFPMVFRHGMDPASGTGLIFQTLPVAFAQMPAGHLVGSVFFFLLTVAALTSIVGLVEALVAWVIEKTGRGRRQVTVLVMTAIGVVSVLSVLSYSVLGNFHIFGRDVNGVLDFLSSQVFLPVGGLMIALFAGWVVRREDLESELAPLRGGLLSLWRLLIRFVVPLAVLVILLSGLL